MTTCLARVVVIGVTLLAVLAHPAAAAPLLEDGDAAELAQSLADASDEQDICYGWQIDVQDDSGGPSGQEIGSNLGPGRLVSAAAGSCKRTVVLEGVVSYTCDSCESEDSASVRVRSSVPGGPTFEDLEDLGLKGGDLTKDTGDVVLINMVGALPLIVASKGAATPVPVEPSTVVPAASDGPTNRPSTPDWLRDSWLALSALLILVAGGAFWLFRLFNDDRRRRRAAARAADLRNSGGGITKSLAAREATADPPPDPAA